MAMRIDREALGRAGRTLRTFAAKYRIAILAALLGLLLLLWPTGSRRETVKTETAASGFSLAETEVNSKRCSARSTARARWT